MILSKKHKFIFLCLPRTGTTAIRKELCDNYGGEEILYKHAPYDQYLRWANNDQRNYKVLASVRNPLDRTVSLYFKYKSNHDGIHIKQIKDVGNKNFIQKGFITIVNAILTNRAKNVSKQQISFKDFILKYYNFPYSDWHSLYFDKYLYILHFENINSDFKNALSDMGIQAVRDIPFVNVTKKENKSFEEYYSTDIIPIVQKNFYHAMKMYGYEFPLSWPSYTPAFKDKLRYKFHTLARQFYWKFIR
jgi:hypothetical protein